MNPNGWENLNLDTKYYWTQESQMWKPTTVQNLYYKACYAWGQSLIVTLSP
jgi:hypothetical protein